MKINYSLIWSLILCISYTPLINSLLQGKCNVIKINCPREHLACPVHFGNPYKGL